jgi:peroxiredoxin
VDGPAIGAPSINDDGEAVAAVPKQIEPIIKQLTEIKTPTRPEETYNYHLSRAQLLEEAVAKTSGIEQVPWLKQLIDAYTAAVESNPTSDKVALPRLKAWKEQIMITPGATETQAYVSIRFAAAEYASNLANAKSDTEFRKLHNNWREQLDTFVKTFPKAAEAPEALMRLAVAYEFDGREGDAGAKAAYERLVRDYPSHMLAPKAAGAIKRLGSEGQPFQFSGTTLDGKAFSEAVLAGKTAIVYFWASWANGSTAELKALAELEKAHSAKGVVIVTVSLDDDAASAINSIREAQLPGYHLHAAGGLDRSPLANAYGVQMVPHIMLVNKEGKVASRGAQNGEGLKAELDKLIK